MFTDSEFWYVMSYDLPLNMCHCTVCEVCLPLSHEFIVLLFKLSASLHQAEFLNTAYTRKLRQSWI